MLRRSMKSSFLICTFCFLFDHAGSNHNSDIRAHRVYRFIHHAHTKRSQATVSYWSGVYSVSVFDIHSIRLPEKEIIDCR